VALASFEDFSQSALVHSEEHLAVADRVILVLQPLN